MLDQNYPNLEYIIVDGGSTDNTVSIIKKYEKYLVYWTSENDKGQTDAINKGFSRCTGEVFNWINSDDYYEPGTFEKLAVYFSDQKIDVVCGREWGFYEGTNKRMKFEGSVIAKDVFGTILAGTIDQPCTFFRRKKIELFFPLHTSLRYVMDRQLWWQYLLQNGQESILQVDDVFTHFRLHNDSKSVAEQAGFEKEFDALKHSLFVQLNAPPHLMQQLASANDTLHTAWSVRPEQREAILAAFASFYAERNYVQKNRPELQQLTRLLQNWKGFSMNRKEWKWWLVAHVFPAVAFHYLKGRKP